MNNLYYTKVEAQWIVGSPVVVNFKLVK